MSMFYDTGDGDRIVTISRTELLDMTDITYSEYDDYEIDFSFHKDDHEKVYILLARRPAPDPADAAGQPPSVDDIIAGLPQEAEASA